MKKSKYFTIILLCLVMTACSRQSEQNFMISDTLHSNLSRTNTEEETYSVGVYVDTTPSMQGFIRGGDNEEIGQNNYILCLDHLDRMIAGEEYVEFYRVDTPLWKVEENVLQEAKNLKYYVSSEELNNSKNHVYVKIGDDNGYDSLCLISALNNGLKQDLFVLVTDFYENGGNAGELIKTLKEIASSDDGKIFGMIGIRSGFEGIIYDSGPYGESIQLGTEEQMWRQFYVIVRGYPQKVKEFCSRLTDKMNIDDKYCQSIIFYEEEFQTLDFNNFDRSLQFDESIWMGDKYARINGEKNLPIYDYTCKQNVDTKKMFFSFYIPEEVLQEFKVLGEQYGESKEVDLGEGQKAKMVRLKCNNINSTVETWSEAAPCFENQTKGEKYFEVQNIYFSDMEEALYVELDLYEDNFTSGIWKIHWQSVIEIQEEILDVWNEEWCYKEGSGDYKKTERLDDYIQALSDKMKKSENCILDGVIYLNVKEKK